MNNSDFKQLVVWQKSMDIVENVYNLIKSLPIEEKYGLCDQLRRCSVSIPSNIAEGHRRNSNREFMHFISISRGSIAELETQLLLCQRLRYSESDVISQLCDKLQEIDKMLASLLFRLSRM
ncbi:MAG: four helix bundle protein [Muribaculaceae bacterium]|nr:four helix bundle protein [Muribaculaceae bacterium]